jgi:carotenoid 1,2-hydratase
MTERGRRALERSGDAFRLGASTLRWSPDGLAIELDEVSTPHERPIRGLITLRPLRGGGPAVALDEAARHGWRPIAPDCHAAVTLSTPEQAWSGHGYLDTNWGARPISEDFDGWDWSRSCGGEPRAFYDLQRRDGSISAFGAGYGPDGVFGVTEATPHAPQSASLWRLPRRAPGQSGEIAGTLEDTPFYARSLIRSRIGEAETMLMHERLDCRRLASRWVQALLPFRMPRAP